MPLEGWDGRLFSLEYLIGSFLSLKGNARAELSQKDLEASLQLP